MSILYYSILLYYYTVILLYLSIDILLALACYSSSLCLWDYTGVYRLGPGFHCKTFRCSAMLPAPALSLVLVLADASHHSAPYITVATYSSLHSASILSLPLYRDITVATYVLYTLLFPLQCMEFFSRRTTLYGVSPKSLSNETYLPCQFSPYTYSRVCIYVESSATVLLLCPCF